MKKYLVSAGAAVVMILYAAPWLWIDNGENILERNFRPTDSARGIDETFFAHPKNTCSCDGSCINVRWMPFGAKVEACSYDYYYYTFWGQKFYRQGH